MSYTKFPNFEQKYMKKSAWIYVYFRLSILDKTQKKIGMDNYKLQTKSQIQSDKKGCPFSTYNIILNIKIL